MRWTYSCLGSQLPQGNSNPLLNLSDFSEQSVLALEDWCKLVTQLHEGLFLHAEVLKSLLGIPGFQTAVIPPYCGASPALEVTVNQRTILTKGIFILNLSV